MSFCSICTGTGLLHVERIDGHEVNVCMRCTRSHPRSGRYSFASSKSDDGPQVNVPRLGEHNSHRQREP